MFYLNVVGYKGPEERRITEVIWWFYLNVVGYKDIGANGQNVADTGFYLNVVGYKGEYSLDTHNGLPMVLSERSGI